MSAKDQLGLDSLLDHRGTQPPDSADRGLREGPGPELAQWVAPPQRKGFAEQFETFGPRVCGAPGRKRTFEAREVDLARVYPQDVTRCAGLDALLTERFPQRRDVNV